MRSILASILFSCAISACTGSGSGQVTYSGGVAAPDLVEIEPGVQVIADYDEPVFYSDNYYWRQDGGVWYRSHDYRRGWNRADNEVPVAIRRIDRPQAYVHYHASGTARADVRDHRNEGYHPNPTYPTPTPGPEVRDHRDDNMRPDQRPDMRGDMRDHRDDHRDDRRDGFQPQPQPQPVQPVQPTPPPQRVQPRPPEAQPQRDIRQDIRQDQREERKDIRQDQREERKDVRQDQRQDQRDQRKDDREQRKNDKRDR